MDVIALVHMPDGPGTPLPSLPLSRHLQALQSLHGLYSAFLQEYVPPLGGPVFGSGGPPHLLLPQILAFLEVCAAVPLPSPAVCCAVPVTHSTSTCHSVMPQESAQTSLLVTAPSGAGKTALALYLVQHLLTLCGRGDGAVQDDAWVPLFISLPSVGADVFRPGAVWEYVQANHFLTEGGGQELRGRRILYIFDSMDEVAAKALWTLGQLPHQLVLYFCTCHNQPCRCKVVAFLLRLPRQISGC